MKPFFTGSDWYLGAVDVEERFPYVRCAGCGTVAAHPAPTPETLRRAYASGICRPGLPPCSSACSSRSPAGKLVGS